jgi:diacylglycerol kinase family enzyme
MNLFARAIGMPIDPLEAAAALPGARSRAIDMLEVNGRAVLMHASIGLQPHVILQRDQMTYRTRAGKIWYGIRAWARVLRRPPRLRFSIRTGETAAERAATAVLLSNNQLSQETGEVPVSDELGSRRLALYICTSPRRRDLVRLTLAVSFGAWRSTGLVEEIVAEVVEISARRKKLLVSADGELSMFDMPLKCRIVPGCVCVLFPAKKQ